MQTIAVISMGEMGAGIAGLLVANGARVITALGGRSAASRARADAAGVEVVDDRTLVEQAELLLSIVPPAAAGEVAQHWLGLIEQAAHAPMYLDCNAIAPQTLHELAQPFLDRSLAFGDAGIIGPSPKIGGSSPRFYLSGAVEAACVQLAALGLDARQVSDQLGDASSLKMAYAGITKGFQALASAMAVGAARHGGQEILLAELQASQPGLYGWLARQLPLMYPKAYRWEGEMREIARFLEPQTGAVQMLDGAAELYAQVAQSYRAGPDSEIIAALDRFAKG